MVAGHGDEFNISSYAVNGSGTTSFNTRPKRTLYVDHSHQVLIIIHGDESVRIVRFPPALDFRLLP